ncbi:MAG: universal stress protein [Chitinophagaceae bacterium]|nr:universal stress protein [Chitinophagaceae bacterium]
MQKLFNKILVPVDFTFSSKKAIDKAVEIAVEYNCTIEILHVTGQNMLVADDASADTSSLLTFQEASGAAKKALEQFASIDTNAHGQLQIEFSVLPGTWQQSLVDFIEWKQIDLMLIGQDDRLFQRKELLVNPNLIAGKTNIPVITVPTNRSLVDLYSIVIPVTDYLPVRKLIYGIYMATKHTSTVKLLGIENDQTRSKVRYYLQRAFELIRDNCSLHVELETIESNNVADAVSSYAITSAADLVIVNPDLESNIPGFLSGLLGNITNKSSAPPVLTINTV